MKNYQVIDRFVTIGAGTVVRMNEDMALRRKARINEARGKDTYELLDNLHFKHGEVIGLKELPKNLIDRVAEYDPSATTENSEQPETATEEGTSE